MADIAYYLKIAGVQKREMISLLALVCNREASWLYAHPAYTLTAAENKKIKNRFDRLQQGEPLAYILSFQDFFNCRFRVSPAVLIPRPESELIVEDGLEYVNKNKQALIFDLGTGSGALIISLANELQKNNGIFTHCRFYAGDISAAALTIAKSNAKTYKLTKNIIFKKGDLFLPFTSIISKYPAAPIFIAANLPYLTPAEQKNEPSIAREPKLALVGGRDGLSLYRRLLAQLKPALADRSFCVIMEINPNQAGTLSKLAKTALPQAAIKKVPDLTGRTRFISITR